MQVHKATQASPCLASTHPADASFCMQIHARYTCTALYKAACQKKGPHKEKGKVQKSRWLDSGCAD